MSKYLTTDARESAYWLEAAPFPDISTPQLLPSYDVAVVGSGYTGLHSALRLLRAGRSVAVFEPATIGFGASRRNAGFLGRVLKKSFDTLSKRHGRDYALAVYRELNAALQGTLAFIDDEAIECHAVRCGRFVGATSHAHLEALQRNLASLQANLGFPYSILGRGEQRNELASDIYFGGAVIPDLGALHPGLYHQGLTDRVLAAGGALHENAEVLSLSNTGSAVRIETRIGSLSARDVVIATNGYTPRQFAWHARRVVPFTGYIAATEPLPPQLLRKVLPNRRTVIDTRVNIDFFRPAPDSPRLIFGGATGCGLSGIEPIAERLHGILSRVLPDLADVKLSHVWTGQCAGTIDMMPHIGRRDGAWYAMGYNYAGVPMGTYLGMKIADQILGRPDGETIFSKAPFPTLPFYRGTPWFVPWAMRYFDWHDNRIARRKPRQAA